jgi:pimeloyl-ACP methyl ester carboxylesterase
VAPQTQVAKSLEKQPCISAADSSSKSLLSLWKTILKDWMFSVKELYRRVRYAIMAPIEDRFIFYSKIRRTIPLDPEIFNLPGFKGVKKIQIASAVKNKYGEPIKLNGLYHPAKPGHPTILVSYGSGDSLNRIKKFTNIIPQGTGVLLYDHPGHGVTEGFPSEKSLNRAFKDARQYLAEQGVPHQEQVLYGYSMGGGVVVHSAAKRPAKALILESTMPALADVVKNRMQNRLGKTLYSYLPIHQLLNSQFLSEEKLKGIKTPLLILHGRQDPMMPMAFADRLYAAAENCKSRRLEFLEGNHSVAEELTTPHVKTFLQQLG